MDGADDRGAVRRYGTSTMADRGAGMPGPATELGFTGVAGEVELPTERASDRREGMTPSGPPLALKLDDQLTDIKLRWSRGPSGSLRRAACNLDRPLVLSLCALFALVGLVLGGAALILREPSTSSRLKLHLPATSMVVSRVIHGSCSKQTLDHPFWATVLDLQPDLFVYNGDIVYGDCSNVSCVELDQAWADLFSNPDFSAARMRLPITGIPDDHDYGQNDCDASNPYKEVAKRMFLDRFGVAVSDERRKRGGLHQEWTFGPPGKKLQIILLETRWFRSAFKRTMCSDCIGRYVPYSEPESRGKTILGEQQWAWLEEKLRKPADLRLIFSTIQILSDTHGWESWAQIPTEVTRLRRLIRTTNANGVVLFSGDRHVGAVYSAPAASSLNPYTLYEVTASSFTHSIANAVHDEPASRGDAFGSSRLGGLLHLNNFGTVDVDWDAREVTLGLVVADTCAIPGDNGCMVQGAVAGSTAHRVVLHLDRDLSTSTDPSGGQSFTPSPPLPPAPPPKLIIDTDLGFDADDAAAICIAHALADAGEIEFLGVTHNSGYPGGIAAVAAINTWYGRGPGDPREIHLGAYKGTFGKVSAECASGQHGCHNTWPVRSLEPPYWIKGGYVDELATRFPTGGVTSANNVPDALTTLRRLLSAPGGKDISIVAIGFATNLAALIDSPPDHISPLSGRELVRQRVYSVVYQGGWYAPDHPDGHTTFNFECGRPFFDGEECMGASARAVNALQEASLGVRNIFTALGDEVRTGGPLSSCVPEASPCRAAFRLNADPTGSRPSWDPIAVLAAARGEDHPSLRAVPEGGAGAVNFIDGDGANFWSDHVLPRASGVGLAGGRCVCDGGSVYWAGVEGEGCDGTRLACDGGKSGECHTTSGVWSHTRVVCAINASNPDGGHNQRPGSVFLVQQGSGNPDPSERRRVEAAIASEINELLCSAPRYGASSTADEGEGRPTASRP